MEGEYKLWIQGLPANTGRLDSRNMAILIAQGMVSKDIVLLHTATIASPMGWIEVIRFYEDRCRVCQTCRENPREMIQGAAEPDCPQSRGNQNEQRPPRFFREWA